MVAGTKVPSQHLLQSQAGALELHCGCRWPKWHLCCCVARPCKRQDLGFYPWSTVSFTSLRTQNTGSEKLG